MGPGRLARSDLAHNYAMTNDRLIRQAREAAIRRRAAGGPVLPLSEAFYLDPETAQLLDALMALGILEPADLPGLSADSVSTERTPAA